METWRYSPLVETLWKSFSIEASVLLAPFSHFSGGNKRFNAAEKLHETLGVRDVFIGRLLSVTQLIWAQSFPVVLTNHPYRLLRAPVSLNALSSAFRIFSPYTFQVTGNRGLLSSHSRLGPHNIEVVVAETSKHLADYLESGWSPHKAKLLTGGFPSTWDQQAPRISNTPRITFAPHWTAVNTEAALQRWDFAGIVEELARLNRFGQILLTVREHPRFREYLVRFADDQTIEAYEQLVRATDLTEPHSGSISELFAVTDVLVHNSASFLAEFALTGKPFIWVGGSSIEQELNSTGGLLMAKATKISSGKQLGKTLSRYGVHHRKIEFSSSSPKSKKLKIIDVPNFEGAVSPIIAREIQARS